MHENLEYTESGWNLNNTPMLPGSLLLFENSETSTASVPNLFVGMCFSSLCWKVEEHYLYSLCYLHLGSPKVWYGIPARYCYKFEGVVKKHLWQYSEQPGLLWKSITQLAPSVLISEGIPVYRCVQSSMEFVLTFPGAYHCEFDCGFNCSERVNFAPFDWLSYGQHIVELYSEQCRKTSISHDKLLLGAAMVAVRVRWEISVLRSKMLETMVWINNSGEDGVLTKLLKLRITQEVARREYLCNSFDSRKMEDDFDLTTKRECSRCMFDLHLSAIGCLCCPGKYTCLVHAKHLCSCGLNAKCLLFRYDINELNSLVKALEGDIEAVKKWSVEKLGLTMSSNVSREADDITVPVAVSAPVEPVTSAAASPNLRSSAAVQMEGPLVQETEVKLREHVGASSSEREVVIILSDDDEE